MRSLKYVITVVALAGFLVVSPSVGDSAGASVIPLSLQDLVEGSTCCVRGVVVDAETQWTVDGSMLYTTYFLQPMDCLMGSVGGVVKIKVPGGHRDGLTIRNSEAPIFELGEDVVVFGNEISPGVLKTFGWFQGKYTLLDGMVRELRDTSWSMLRGDIEFHVSRKQK